MSTANYYSAAGNVYAIDLSDCDDFTGEYLIEDIKEGVLKDLKANEDSDDTGDRNYPGEYFGRIEDLPADDYDVFFVTAGLIIRSGYYANANLDYEIKVVNNYSGEYLDLDEIDEATIIDALEDANGRKPTKKQIAKLKRKIDAQALQLEDRIKEVYTEYTTPLLRVATFSNGEAIYEEIGGDKN